MLFSMQFHKASICPQHKAFSGPLLQSSDGWDPGHKVPPSGEEHRNWYGFNIKEGCTLLRSQLPAQLTSHTLLQWQEAGWSNSLAYPYIYVCVCIYVFRMLIPWHLFSPQNVRLTRVLLRQLRLTWARPSLPHQLIRMLMRKMYRWYLMQEPFYFNTDSKNIRI